MVKSRAKQPLAHQTNPPRDFDSSDAVRSAAPLLHARHVTFDAPLKLELGGELPEVSVAYETYGELNDAGDNAVLICHAISGDSHVARHDDADLAGWWDVVVGPGRFIDTKRYFVVCSNVLGGCRGTTGPNSIDPVTGQPYASDFPTITIADTVEVQRRLIDHLGIGKLLAVIGGSMGGHQAITWAIRHPDRVARMRGGRDLAAAHHPGVGVRRGGTQRHHARPALPRRPLLRRSGTRPSVSRWPGCSGTSPTCRPSR